MKTCPSCGSANGDAATACQWCDTALPVSEAAGRATGAASEVPLPPPPPGAGQAMQYSHSGVRYLLGYSATSFGIWDRERPSAPVETFPRTDDGWRAAWLRYSALEPTNVDVALASGVHGVGQPVTTGSAWDGSAPTAAWPPKARRTVSGWWWVLPIVMGWLGGLIAWLVNREDDPQKARQMLLVGVAISVLSFLLILPALSAMSS